jgi:hypothetical protein
MTAPVPCPWLPQQPKHLQLEEAYLSSFGHLHLPQHLHTALQRFDALIEPALLTVEAQASLPLMGGG